MTSLQPHATRSSVGFVGVVRRYSEAMPGVLMIECERMADGFTSRRQARKWAKQAARAWQAEESY